MILPVTSHRVSQLGGELECPVGCERKREELFFLAFVGFRVLINRKFMTEFFLIFIYFF